MKSGLSSIYIKYSLPCNSANALATGFCCCNIFALSRSSISNDEEGIPPVREDICDGFTDADCCPGNCTGNTGEGELERGPEGDVIGFKPAEAKDSSAVGACFSSLKYK